MIVVSTLIFEYRLSKMFVFSIHEMKVESIIVPFGLMHQSVTFFLHFCNGVNSFYVLIIMWTRIGVLILINWSLHFV